MGMTYYVTALFEFMLALQFHQNIFVQGYPKRENFLIRFVLSEILYVLSGAFIMLLFSMGVFTSTAILMYALVFVFSYIVLRIPYDLKTTDALFAASCGYAAQHIGAAIGNILQYLTHMNVISAWIRFPVGVTVQILIGVFIYQVVVKKHMYDGEQREKDARIVALAGVVLFATIFLSVWSDRFGASENAEAILLGTVICKLYAILLCVLIISMEYMISHMNMVDRQKEFMEQMIREQAEQYRLSNESISIINRKCHDLKYQMRALKFEENAQKRSEYIDELREAVSIYDAVFHTENEALNMLLREKTLLCDEYEIQFSCIADGKCLNFMSADDIFVLLGNALDNAIESVTKEDDISKRIISLSIASRQNMAMIHLENYCKEPVQFENGLPKTSKEDKNYHGFGTQSIHYLVEKYDGSDVMQYQDHMFYLDIVLPIREVADR